VYESVKISVFMIIFTLITFGVLSYRAAEQANASLRTAQLHQLTQQMQPHFLFNALNTISSLMHTDVDRADATLMQLADVLRATLDVSGQQQAPLSTELRLLRGYARLMEERFVDRVQVEWDIDADCGDCQVPVMSTQPLLENVFKHTVERRRGVTKIAISARRDGDALLLAVSDDAGRLPAHLTNTANAAAVGAASGSGSSSGSGIGVRNLRERLQALHGERASLRLVQLEPTGVRAEMRLPCVS
jgi:LytS/YehU family sensor histidine kinase